MPRRVYIEQNFRQSLLRTFNESRPEDLGIASNDNTAISAPLRDFMLVGGLVEMGGVFRRILSPRDRLYLDRAMDDLAQCGADVSPDFQVSTVNLNWFQGHEDFLSRTFNARADVVISCFLYDGGKHGVEGAGVYANSPRHNEPDVWHDSVIKTGARALLTVGLHRGENNGVEVDRSFFMKEGGRLQAASQKAMKGRTLSGSTMETSIYTQTHLLLRDDYKTHLEQKKVPKAP